MTDDSTIGQRVREARERVGMTQTALGERLGWPRQTVSQIELGQRSVLARELLPLARALDASVWELLGQRV
jgi:transcriptional regulator with XRE-family HTH domain